MDNRISERPSATPDGQTGEGREAHLVPTAALGG